MAGLFAKTTPLLGTLFSRAVVLPAMRQPTASAVGLMVRNYRSSPTLFRRIGMRVTRRGPTKQCPRCGAAIPLAACPCPRCSGLVELDPDGRLSHYAILGYSNPEPHRSCRKSETALHDEIRKLGARGSRLDPNEVMAMADERLAALHPNRWKSDLLSREDEAILDRARWRITEAARVLCDYTARHSYIVSSGHSP